MAAAKVTVQASPPAPDVTRRACVVTFSSTGATVTIDLIDPTVAFDANEGDSVSAVLTDTNASGDSPASDPFNWTVVIGGGPPPPPPPGVPTKPTITGMTATAP